GGRPRHGSAHAAADWPAAGRRSGRRRRCAIGGALPPPQTGQQPRPGRIMIRMPIPIRRLALLFAVAAGSACSAAQSQQAVPGTTIVILARHAEKASETETDPELSRRGRERAAALGRALEGARLTGG